MGREDMRAGDGDRQQVVDQLKAALDEGRLDLNEYDERIQQAYSAKTYGDLDGLLDDLPGTVPVQHAQVEPVESAAAAPVAKSGHRPHGDMPWGLSLFLLCTLVWAVSSATTANLQHFWPAWVLIPVILAMLGSAGGHGRKADRNKRRR